MFIPNNIVNYTGSSFLGKRGGGGGGVALEGLIFIPHFFSRKNLNKRTNLELY